MKRFLATLGGSCLFTGFFPFASATFASIVWLALFLFVPGGRWLTAWPVLIVMVFVALWCAHEMEKIYGRDASPIVIDEFVGMQVSLFMVEPDPLKGVLGFLLFRIFDILKPFPVDSSQRLPGGLGVVADDLLAGVYARVALLVLVRLFAL